MVKVLRKNVNGCLTSSSYLEFIRFLLMLFFKTKANIKTSILHLRKKIDDYEQQDYVFMSVSNNIEHDNATNETPNRNNLNEIFTAYMEWRRTGNLENAVRENQGDDENLECPMQYWLVSQSELTMERFDSFFYCQELQDTYSKLKAMADEETIMLIAGKSLKLKKKLSKVDKKGRRDSNKVFWYFEIGDITRYGLITRFIEGTFDELPTRGEYLIKQGDILMALNNSSRGTVVLVPKEFDGAVCTSSFLVIEPKNEEEGLCFGIVCEAKYAECRYTIWHKPPANQN